MREVIFIFKNHIDYEGYSVEYVSNSLSNIMNFAKQYIKSDNHHYDQVSIEQYEINSNNSLLVSQWERGQSYE